MSRGRKLRSAARRKGKKPSRRRLLSRRAGLVALLAFAAYAAAGVWYAHHSTKWLASHDENWPTFVTAPLLAIGNPVGDLTDAVGWTGHDAVYEYDQEAPSGATAFAGLPRRTGFPAPTDITVLDRGPFKIGWSPSLRHPVWVAYHVPREARHEPGARPNFRQDKGAERSPAASAYERTGYDRGHMAPNYAMATRYGEDIQRLTFLMSNIAPQTPALNRGVWRDVEHRIADLWTARYGEIWVVVGCISPRNSRETLSGTDVNVPTRFYQLVVAQEGLDVRALAVLFDQTVPGGEYAARHLVTIRELEEATGLDFLPDLPNFIRDPLEAELPSRLWPIRYRDVFKLLALRFTRR